MATSNNRRDVKLGVEIETAGEENLKRIAAEVRALAKAGGEAAPQYLELADAIERNAAVARELTVFKQAAAAIEQTSAASESAAASAQRLRQEYEKQAEATQALQANQRRVAEALDSTKRQLNAAAEQATVAKNALKGADDVTGELAKTSKEASDKLADLKRQVSDLGLDLVKANREAKESGAALTTLADQSLRADDAARSLASSLRAEVESMERARAAAAGLDADFTNVAVAQERLDAALRGGAGALEAAAATERLAREQQQAAAAVNALTDNLDAQAATVRGKLVASLTAASEAYEREQAAIAESIALGAREAAANERKAALANRLAQLRAEDAAILRGETAERQRALAVAEEEQQSIRESEQFLAEYNRRKAEAAAEADRFVEALHRERTATLEAAAAAEKLAAATDKSARDAQYVRELAAAFDAVDRQAAEAAAQVQKLQGYFDKIGQQRNIIDGAFGTTGVRSIQAIEQEMFKLQRALVTLKGEFSDGRISMADFERATGSAQVRLAALKREIETIPGSKGVFDELAEGANNLITKFGALGAAVATVGFAFAPLVREFVALESTTRILTQVTGSAAEAGRQVEFLRGVAQKSGQAFGEVSQSYAKFAASALQAGLSNEQVQATFKNVALAAGNLGLSSDQAKRALEALGQIASKGTVSMEELRQQLGDALPGVLPLLAKELGITNSELNKLVESGQLAAGDAIPAIAKALETLGPKTGVVDGLVASFNRFKNVVFEVGTSLLDGPIGQAAGGVLEVLAKALEGIAVLAIGVSESFTILGRSLGAIAAYSAGGIKSLKDLGKELVNIKNESNASLKNFADRVLEGADASGELTRAAAAAAAATGKQGAAAAGAAAPTAALAGAVGAAGTAAAGAAAPQAALATAVGAAGTAAAAAVAPQEKLAGAVGAASVAAQQASKSVPQLQVAYQALIASAANAAQASKLAAEARKTEIETLKDVAALTGNEVLIKRTAVEAANQLAAAVTAQAAAEQKQLDVEREYRVALEAKLRTKGSLTEQEEKDLKRRDDELSKQTQAVQKTIEQAESLERQALAARLSGEVLADNSKRQEEFAAAADEAAAAVERARIALEGGTGTAREYRDAVAQAAFQQGRLNDTVRDGIKGLEEGAKLRSADSALRTAGLKIQLEEIRNAEAKYKADGNATMAAWKHIEAKRLELEITKLNNQAKLQEAQAAVEATRRTLEEADAGRLHLTPEKRAELEVRLKVAQARVKEAEASAVGQKRTEEEIKTLVNARLELNRLAAGFDSVTEATKRADDAALRYGSTLRSTQYDAEKFALGMDGQRFTTGNNTLDPLYAKKTETGAQSKFDSALKASALANDKVQNYGKYFLTTGVDAKTTGARKAALQLEAQDAAAAVQIAAAELAAAKGNTAKVAGAQQAAQAPAAAAASAGKTVNINLAGLGSTSVRVASDADAERLVSMFRQIEEAMARSGG